MCTDTSAGQHEKSSPKDSVGPFVPLKIAVGIPTTGRPETLCRTIDHIQNQSRQPDKIIIAPITEDDVRGLDRNISNLKVALGPAGLSNQRNTILQETKDFDILVFFDDDFFPCNDYLQATESFFWTHPNTVVMTGKVIVDGINGPGLTMDEAETLLVQRPKDRQRGGDTTAPTYNGYGCNMSIRLRDVVSNNVLFDENLPQYSWLEDLDFSRRLAAFGDILYFPGAQGVHLGSKKGRQSGVKLGYSQVANVIYLMRKGTCNRSVGMSTMVRNISMNLARSLIPEPYVDRAGRCYGNLVALGHALSGRLDPRNIEHM